MAAGEEDSIDYTSLLKNLHDGKKIRIDTGIAKTVAERLMKGIFEGFGGGFDSVAYDTPDYNLLANLERNVYQFSAAKNYQMLKQLTLALKEGERVRSYNEFEREATGIVDKYNRTWLRTEYESAVGGAQMAGKWMGFEQNESVLPMLQFLVAPGENVCPICKDFDKVIKPMNDPFWSYAYPLLHFKCHCDVIQVNNGRVTPAHETPGDENIPKMFRVNMAKEQLAFPPEHPYYEGVPKKTLRKWVDKNAPKRDE